MIVRKSRKFAALVRSNGLISSIKYVAWLMKASRTTDFKIAVRRKTIAADLSRRFSFKVAYGPFKGFQLNPDNWWGLDLAAMYFGLYEQEILVSLTNIPKQYNIFIDVGAADGYYGVGVLVNNLFSKSYCFEQSEAGRMSISRTAVANGVADQVTIFGTAERNFYDLIPPDDRQKAVLLIDIEGAEFELMTSKVFKQFQHSIIFIELHERMLADGHAKLAELKKAASEYFNITEFTTTARDLSEFRELDDLTDDDRWLICSEGRSFRMIWYRLDPKLTTTAQIQNAEVVA